MILAGAPKSGKSLLASEIALMLATPFGKNEKRILFPSSSPIADGFKGFAINRPDDKEAYKVLFVSLEMRAPEVGARLGKQIGGLKLVDMKDQKRLKAIELEHIFGLPRPEGEDSDLQVIESQWSGNRKAAGTSADYGILRKLVQEVGPDLVIYDTLVQMHREDENDNVMMNGLLKTLRRMTSKDVTGNDGKTRPEPVAHIILHHTRKLGAAARGGRLTADDMRGAGAFHGAADIVLMVRPVDRELGMIQAEVSARSTSIPAFLLSRGSNLTHTAINQKRNTEGRIALRKRLLTEVILKAVESGKKLAPQRMIDRVAKAYGTTFRHPDEDSIKRSITKLAEKGLLAVQHTSPRIGKKPKNPTTFTWGDTLTLRPAGRAGLKKKKNPAP